MTSHYHVDAAAQVEGTVGVSQKFASTFGYCRMLGCTAEPQAQLGMHACIKYSLLH